MRTFALCLVVLLGLGGCAMAGPGVARGTPSAPPGMERETTYNSTWVNKPRGPLDTLDSPTGQKIEVTDISKYELGKVYTDPDVASGKYASEADKKIALQLEKRQEAWRNRMGIRTIVDEQQPSKGSGR
ncbi:MAG: hypothetical protein HS108_14780 [Planctomycetes bacterium]|nr:hypothetical protein [Planctomycetota bacterium]MCL4730294.1 hypothetical protein [Planctomycetota bacterium]